MCADCSVRTFCVFEESHDLHCQRGEALEHTKLDLTSNICFFLRNHNSILNTTRTIQQYVLSIAASFNQFNNGEPSSRL